MDFLRTISVAASGTQGPIGRMRVIAENIANADSTANAPGADPYRRKVASFSRHFDRDLEASVVGMGRIRTDQAPFRTKYDPGHPSADAKGEVKLPNVNSLVETDRHARGAALLRGQPQPDHRHPPHDLPHPRNPARLGDLTDDHECLRRRRLCATQGSPHGRGPARTRRAGRAAISRRCSKGALDTVAQTGKAAEAQALAAASGKADIVDVVTAVAESEAALETLVAVRDRVIAAYEEIMRMPI